jgi:hypothetical protein
MRKRMTPFEMFCLRLAHHGKDADTGLTFLFMHLCREAGFRLLPRSSTLTMARNGRTIVIERKREENGTVIQFHFVRDRNTPIVTVRSADLRRVGHQGKSWRTQTEATHAMLMDIVQALLKATEAKAA